MLPCYKYCWPSLECARIDQLLESLGRGQGAALVISGEAGMGKTRLVQELIGRANQKELPCFTGRAGPGTGSIPYNPFIELFIDILDKQAHMSDMLPPELRRLIPAFSDEDQPLPHADKLVAKGYLFARVHHFFSKLIQEKPAVIILEDLHTTDQESQELLWYLLRHRGRLSTLFVCTFRKEEGDPVPSFVSDLQDHAAEILELAPLSYQEQLELLQLHAESSITGTDTASYIYKLAEGNPFFTLELLRHFRENSGSDREKQSSGPLPHAPLSESLPTSVHQVVEQKLAKLSPAARHLLYMAAVIGRQVPYELLASIWNSGHMEPDYGLYNALEELIRARLLEEHGLAYCFRHAIVHETIYSSISEARRQIFHQQLARQLLDLSANANKVPVALIAWHFLGARNMPEAAHYLIQAGERAESVYAHEHALQCYREAFDVLEIMKDTMAIPKKCDLLERMGDIYRGCGQSDKSYDVYEKAISLAEDHLQGKQQLMELHRKMAVSAICCSETDFSEIHLEKAFELAADEPRSQVRLFITKAFQLWHLNRLEDAYELAKKALSQADKADSPAEASQACETLAMICLPLGRWEEGLQYEQTRQKYGWSPEIVVATDAHHCLGEYHVPVNHPRQKTRSFMEQLSHQTSRLGDLHYLADRYAPSYPGNHWSDEHTVVAEKRSSMSGLHAQTGSPAGMAYSLARKSVLHTLTGSLEPGWQDVQEGFGYAEKAAVGNHCLQRLYGTGIWNRLEAEDIERAGKLIEKSEKLLAGSGACTACTLELYPWFSYYFLETKQPQKVRVYGKAVRELAEKTGNPIAGAIAFMIKSSRCLLEMDGKQATKYSNKSYRILEEEIPQTVHAPVAHFLKRMLEQQAALVQQ